MTTALLDRLTHHCDIVETGNESWRFTSSSRPGKPLRMSTCPVARQTRTPLGTGIIGADPQRR
ncbi:ATP-binding protein, partial [Aurantimonas coralicida]|uniref:ATP-binding protein n=1 Tax=Aurantimonas coralicida TaxID=182270 RepID=UPI001D187B89